MTEFDEMSPDALGLRMAVVEAERHTAFGGWDQPAKLFALVPTIELIAAEPVMAAELGLSHDLPDHFTAIEQELEGHHESLELLLSQIMWPPGVVGAMAVAERVVLPPSVEAQVPDDPTAAETFAAEHPERGEVRIAAGVLRSGESHCVLRLRDHDDDDSLMHGPDLVPGLVAALRETLE